MTKTMTLSESDLDQVLKDLLLLGRSIDEMLVRRAVSAVSPQPLSVSKVQVLKLIAHKGTQMLGQTARFLGVTDPAASQLVDAMVRDKLVKRTVDSKDRRATRLDLTAAGKRLVDKIEKHQRARVAHVLETAGIKNPVEWMESIRLTTQALAKGDEFCLQCGAYEDGSCVLEGEDHDCLYLKSRAGRTRGGNRRG